MNIEEIKRDKQFRELCGKYGLYYDYAELIEGIIVVPTIKKGIYFFISPEYEIIEIHNQRYEADNVTLEQLARKYKARYEYKEPLYNNNFPYPLQDLSMKDLMDLGRSINVSINDVNLPELRVNDVMINDNNAYSNVLYYIKFLYDQIREYSEYAYKAAMMTYSHPSMDNYTYRLMESINDLVVKFANQGIMVSPSDILSYIGGTDMDLNKYYELFYIVELLNKKYNLNVDDWMALENRRAIDINPSDVLYLSELNKDEYESIDPASYINNKKSQEGLEFINQFDTNKNTKHI